MLCTGYLFIILSGSPVKTELDKRTEYNSSNTCSITYKTCLKKLIRVKERTYRAICGAERNEGHSVTFEVDNSK